MGGRTITDGPAKRQTEAATREPDASEFESPRQVACGQRAHDGRVESEAASVA
jgi:hypothetical protein